MPHSDQAIRSGFAPGRFLGHAAHWVRHCTFHHSLAFKNLVLFLVIFIVSVAPLAYFYWLDTRAHRIEALAARLEVIAGQSARRIDTAAVASLSRRDQTDSPAHRRLVDTLAAIEAQFGVDNAVLLRRSPGGDFHFIADGRDQFYVTQPAFIHERFPETRRAAVSAWEQRGENHTELFGYGTFEYLQVNLPLTRNGEVVGLLLLNKFAEPVDQAIRRDTFRLLLLTLLLVIFGGAGFWLFSRRMLAPLRRLQEAAGRLAGGEAAVEVPPVRRRDEVSDLNEAFRSMVHRLRDSREALERNNEELRRALARVRLMEDLEKNLSRFVPMEVRRALRSDPALLDQGKIEKDVTVLFLDIEGSTVLTEAMEPARIDRVIENYFSQYLDFIYENQGDITETMGDGLMIIFQGDDPHQHAAAAVRTALAIRRATAEICLTDRDLRDCLRVNMGINSGTALVGFSRYESIAGTRMTFTASGRTTIVAARLQAIAKGGSIYLSEETMRRVTAAGGFVALGIEAEPLGSMRLKNIREPERVFRLHDDEPAPPADGRPAADSAD